MPASKSSLIKKAKKVRLIAFDVDGVMTGGEVIVLDSGEEVKMWNSKDRLALALVRDSKLPMLFAFITGRGSDTVERTAKDLGIQYVVQRCVDKKAALGDILKKNDLTFDQAAFVGDDLVDLTALRSVGFSACPSDAASDIKKVAGYVSPLNGGRGVARDVLEFILRAQNRWDPLVKSLLV